MVKNNLNIILFLLAILLINFLTGYLIYTKLENSKNSILLKQNEIHIKDSIFREEQIKYRKDLDSKINSINRELEVLNKENTKIEKEFKESSTNYKNNKYKPIKYW